MLWFSGARGFRGRVGRKNIEERSNWLIGRVIVCKPLDRAFLVFPFLNVKFALGKSPENIISLLSITKILDALTLSQLFGKERMKITIMAMQGIAVLPMSRFAVIVHHYSIFFL